MLTPVPPSDCQRAREAVSTQLDGELSELGSARLAAHLRDCAACSAYALEAAALTSRLRAAPLERPRRPIELSSHRRPGARIAAAAAVAAVALGNSLSPSGQPIRTATRITTPSLQQDIVSQHILAMERRLVPSGSIRVGPLLAL